MVVLRMFGGNLWSVKSKNHLIQRETFNCATDRSFGFIALQLPVSAGHPCSPIGNLEIGQG